MVAVINYVRLVYDDDRSRQPIARFFNVFFSTGCAHVCVRGWVWKDETPQPLQVFVKTRRTREVFVNFMNKEMYQISEQCAKFSRQMLSAFPIKIKIFVGPHS